MEKISQDEETLLLNLRNEEASLMSQVARLMGTPVKTAAEEQSLGQIESRLQLIRAKITEMDLKNFSQTR